jgi:hypothetical protein
MGSIEGQGTGTGAAVPTVKLHRAVTDDAEPCRTPQHPHDVLGRLGTLHDAEQGTGYRDRGCCPHRSPYRKPKGLLKDS